jgi:hypothetical protein
MRNIEIALNSSSFLHLFDWKEKKTDMIHFTYVSSPLSLSSSFHPRVISNLIIEYKFFSLLKKTLSKRVSREK